MAESGLVQRGEGTGDAEHDPAGRLGRQRPGLAHRGGQGGAPDQGARHPRMALVPAAGAGAARADDRGQVRVAGQAGHGGPVGQAAPHVRVGGQPRVEDLERGPAGQAAGEVDRAGGPGAEPCGDTVPASPPRIGRAARQVRGLAPLPARHPEPRMPGELLLGHAHPGELPARYARVARHDDQGVGLVGDGDGEVSGGRSGQRRTQRGAVDQPVDLHDDRPAEAGRAPLDETDADRHPQPDPVVAGRVARPQAGRQRPDQQGEHDGGVDAGRQDGVDPVTGPLVVDACCVERQPAGGQRGHHQLPQAALDLVPFGHRARRVSRDIEHKSHSQRAAGMPGTGPGAYSRGVAGLGCPSVFGPRVLHFFHAPMA